MRRVSRVQQVGTHPLVSSGVVVLFGVLLVLSAPMSHPVVNVLADTLVVVGVLLWCAAAVTVARSRRSRGR